MKTSSYDQGCRGLTLMEVLVVAGVVAVLMVFSVGPFLMQARSSRTKRIRCAANLQQVRLAMLLYANDYNERFPWQVPENEGGTLEYGPADGVLPHYLALTNWLSNPKVLTCPADGRGPANDWEHLRAEQISYFVGLDARVAVQADILSGDSNIGGGTSNRTWVTFGVNNVPTWIRGVHPEGGNLAFSDGRVLLVNSNRLIAAFTQARRLSVNGSIRLIMPPPAPLVTPELPWRQWLGIGLFVAVTGLAWLLRDRLIEKFVRGPSKPPLRSSA